MVVELDDDEEDAGALGGGVVEALDEPPLEVGAGAGVVPPFDVPAPLPGLVGLDGEAEADGDPADAIPALEEGALDPVPVGVELC